MTAVIRGGLGPGAFDGRHPRCLDLEGTSAQPPYSTALDKCSQERGNDSSKATRPRWGRPRAGVQRSFLVSLSSSLKLSTWSSWDWGGHHILVWEESTLTPESTFSLCQPPKPETSFSPYFTTKWSLRGRHLPSSLWEAAASSVWARTMTWKPQVAQRLSPVDDYSLNTYPVGSQTFRARPGTAWGKGRRSMQGSESAFLFSSPNARLQPQAWTAYSAKQKPDPCPTLLLRDQLVGMLGCLLPKV